MKYFFGELIHNSDFLKLWGGETVSRFGTQVTVFSIPMLAALTLNATPAQMGYLGTAMFLPYLVTPLFAGTLVDHHRRKPIMIFMNLIRALLIGSIPVMAFFSEIQMAYLYVVCFLNGIAQVFFELAYHSYIPTLVDRTNLVEANGKIQTSISFAEVGGPALAGFLVEWISAPFALLIDSASFLISALATASIHKPEVQLSSPMSLGKMIENIRQGFRMVMGIPHLRALAGESATFNLFGIIFQTAFTLYATRDLGLSPATLGLIYMTGSLGSLAGALISDKLTNKFGLGRAMMIAFLLACSPYFLLLLLGVSNIYDVAILTITFLISGVGISSSQIYIWSIRQAVTPEGKLGRMNAAYRFFVTGVTPIASLIGGFLGEAIGLRSTVLLGALGCILILPWIYFSPLPTLQKLPDAVDLEKDSNLPLVGSVD